MSMDTEESLKEYLRLQLKIPLIARIGPLARTFDFVANAAPGREGDPHRREARVEVRERTTTSSWSTPPATGHIVGQLAAPRPSTSWCRWAWSASRPAGCRRSSPTRPDRRGDRGPPPEEMPVNETLELAERLARRPMSTWPPSWSTGCCPSCSAAEEEIFERLASHRAAGRRGGGGSVEPLLDAAELAVTLRRTRAEHLTRLREGLPRAAAALRPELFTRTTACGPPPRSPRPSARSSGH